MLILPLLIITISMAKSMIRFASEMTVILRDRINDLLVANAELEREVSRLRYSHFQPESPPDVSLGDPSLEKTK